MERRSTYKTRNNWTASEDTARSLISHVDKKGVYHVEGLRIEVEVLDTRRNYGRTEYLITPISGYGSKWVASGLTLEG